MFLSEVIIYAEAMGWAPVYELDNRQFCTKVTGEHNVS